MIRSIYFLFLLLWHSPLTAQDQYTLSGTVSDGRSGETLIGASISAPALNIGTTTNEYGFYALELPAGDSIAVVFSYVGFQPLQRRIYLSSDSILNVELREGVELEKVVVEANSFREQLRSSEMSVETLSPREAKLIPLLLGESDILKAIQLKPGIPSGAEGSSGLFVRGGGSDQNLIILDEAIVYNANHLFGFFSTFNTDAVKDLKMYKGGFPARYGGRLSSVIDVKLKEGNNKKLSGTGGLGLIASRLTLEGPIQSGKSSFMVSGRRTYADVFTRLVNRANAGQPGFNPIPNYYFYDLNTKINFKLGEKDRLMLSGYFGRDVFGFDDDNFNFDFDWGNATGTLRWNHLFSNKLFSNTTLTFSNYQYNIQNRLTGFSFRVGSNIRDLNLKTDFYYALNNRHTLRFGAQATAHYFEIGRLKAGSDDGTVSFSAGQNFTGLEFGAYFSDELRLSEKLEIQAGLRLSGFQNEDSWIVRPEPRLSGRFNPSERWALKISYARMNQYLHLVSNAGVALPTDIWYPSTRRILPQSSDQLALGLSYLVGEALFLNWEAYYKKLGNQIEFVDGAELFANDELEEEFAIGRGRAYGLEWSIEQKEGRLQGWIGYTLAFVRRGDFTPIVPEASFQQEGYFSPIYDRRHDLSVVALYEISDRFSANATFVYGSGDLRWLPPGRFSFQDVYGGEFKSVVPHYLERNNYRLPPYHRLDLGLVYQLKPKWGESDLTLTVVNVYDRRNTFFIYLEPEFAKVEDEDGRTFQIPERISARQVSLFPVLPALTWNFKF